MAVASHESVRAHQHQHQYTPNTFPASASLNTLFAGSNQHQLGFISTNPDNQTSVVPPWSQTQPVSIPRFAQTPNFVFSSPISGAIDELPLAVDEQVPDLMDDRHWQQTSQGHQQQFSARRGVNRLPAHQRDSSLSTLESAGPSSPFAQNSSNPHIAISDSGPDGLPDFASDAMVAMYAPKQSTHTDSFYSQYPSSLSHSRHHQQPQPQHQQQQQQQQHHTLLPPVEFQQQFTPSNPVSVASSIASDSPATPPVDDHHPQRQPVNRRQKQSAFNPSVPKLDRTMTDVYSDELYNPTFSITTTASPSTPTSAISPNSDVFSQRIHAANTQHLSAAHSPATTISRERSPFRHGSPLAPLSHDFNTPRMPAASHQDMRYQASQQQMRVHIKAEREAATTAAMLHQQHQQISSRQQQQHQHQHQQESVKTISPRDALLEFSEPNDAADFPLFPQQDNSHHFMGLGDTSVAHTTQSFGTIPVTTHDTSFTNFIPSSLPQQYPFMPRDHDSDMHLSTDVDQVQQQQQQRQQQQQQQQSMQSPTSPQKPVSSNTDRGTFSCTYQGCPLRFETAALLQKHKREGHRQAHGLGGGRRDAGLVPGVTNTQNGPHRCTQINPSTGKPCNIEFSRPYDLTRHEDTIHNPKKKKVTCPACTDKKQFSRGDALSRHYRVCHPELTPPGKRRGAGRG